MAGIEGGQKNNENPKRGIWLITRQQFEQLPNGTVLYSSNDGSRIIIGKDVVDDEVRSGFMAIGFYVGTQLPEGIVLKEGGYWGPPTSEDVDE